MGFSKPRQHLVIGGVDVFDAFGAVMTDDYELGSPEVKTYEVDIPGGDGYIDLTEAITGDVVYGKREQSFQLLFPTHDFWPAFRRFKNFVHGRSFDYYIMGIDDGARYRGRFRVDEKYSRLHFGVVSLSVEAEPYRHLGTSVLSVDAGGGKSVVLQGGRCQVQPVVQVRRSTEVVWDGGSEVLEPGSWKVDGLWVTQGGTEVFLNTAHTSHGDVTIAQVDAAHPNMGAVANVAICDLSWSAKPRGEAYAAIVSYDIKDL